MAALIVAANSNGQFVSGPLQSWTDASWGAFKWSTQNSNIFVGDVNGDGLSDLLVQAKPNIVMIDFDVPIPIPTYTPNSFGVALSQGGTTPFQQVGIQQWSRNAFGVDWSPNASDIVVGDFDGNGTDDVLVQARHAGLSSYRVSGNTSGAVFSTGVGPNMSQQLQQSMYRSASWHAHPPGAQEDFSSRWTNRHSADLESYASPPGMNGYISTGVRNNILKFNRDAFEANGGVFTEANTNAYKCVLSGSHPVYKPC